MPAQFLSVTNYILKNRQRAANVKPSTLRRHIEFDPRLPDSDLEEIRHQVNAWADRQIVKARWEFQFAAMLNSVPSCFAIALQEGGRDSNPDKICELSSADISTRRLRLNSPKPKSKPNERATRAALQQSARGYASYVRSDCI